MSVVHDLALPLRFQSTDEDVLLGCERAAIAVAPDSTELLGDGRVLEGPALLPAVVAEPREDQVELLELARPAQDLLAGICDINQSVVTFVAVHGAPMRATYP